MTTNAFLFSWDEYGVEDIVPITQYDHSVEDALAVLNGEPVPHNPLNNILNAILMRARMNGHRHYEVYAVDCTEDFTEEYWRDMWEREPQFCADLIRERGEKLFCNRRTNQNVRVI